MWFYLCMYVLTCMQIFKWCKRLTPWSMRFVSPTLLRIPRQGLFPMVTIPFRGVGSTLRWIIGQFYGCHVSTCKYICCILVHDVSFYPMLQATCDFWWFTAGFSIPFLECQHIFRVSAPWKQAYLDDVPFGTPDFQARYCYTILACACAFHWETDPAYPMAGSEPHRAQVAGLLWSSGWMRWPFQWARSGSWSAGRTLRARGPPLRSKLVDIVRSRPVHANFSGMKKDRKKWTHMNNLRTQLRSNDHFWGGTKPMGK